MAAIDFHTHAFPDDLARRAIKTLEQGCPWKAVGKGTTAALVKSMNKADVGLSVVCAIATKPQQVQGIFDWCMAIRSDRLEPLPSVHPDTPDVAQWIQRFADEGFAGIKIHPQYQSFQADEARMDPIYTAAAESGLFIVSHCGRDIAFPPEDDRAAPHRFATVANRFDELKLVCTHMGGWRMWDQVEATLLGRPNVWLETSFSLGELGPQRATRMIDAHGPARVMLGSDWPWNKQADAVGQVRELDLPDEELGAILFGNASRLLGM